MNYIVSAAGSCNCGMRENVLEGVPTVPAGGVSGGLGVCGYKNEFSKLPVTVIRGQTYREGLCPDASLELGTMFPELVSIYK